MGDNLSWGIIIFLFLGHNVRTRNVRKPIKASQGPENDLVSNKNLTERIPTSGCGPGPSTETSSKMA